MATYALVQKQNDTFVVVDVIWASDDPEEPITKKALENSKLVPDSQWIQGSFNTIGGVHRSGKEPLRMNAPTVGCTYFPERDAFAGPKPKTNPEDYVLVEKDLIWRRKGTCGYPSWVYDPYDGFWKAPVPRPTDGKKYKWNESILNWTPHPENPSGPYEWNTSTYSWDFPPQDGKSYKWNPQTNTWQEVQ